MTNLPTIYIKQGTDKGFTLTITRNGSPENITGYDVYFVVRPKNTLPDEDNTRTVIDKTATITDGPAGLATIELTRADTLEIPVRQYVYEISYKTPQDEVYSHYGYGDFEIAYLSNKLP